MSNNNISGEGVNARISRDSEGRVSVTGNIYHFANAPIQIRWIAPNGPHRSFSFSGSGLPYANAEQAFEGTPNKGLISSPDGSFSLVLNTLPSAYYTGLGSTYVPPVLMFDANTDDKQNFRTHIFLSEIGVPYRWISGAPSGTKVANDDEQNGRSMFYNGRESLQLFRNQEDLLRHKAYPLKTSLGFPNKMDDSNPWSHTPSPA